MKYLGYFLVLFSVLACKIQKNSSEVDTLDEFAGGDLGNAKACQGSYSLGITGDSISSPSRELGGEVAKALSAIPTGLQREFFYHLSGRIEVTADVAKICMGGYTSSANFVERAEDAGIQGCWREDALNRPTIYVADSALAIRQTIVRSFAFYLAEFMLKGDLDFEARKSELALAFLQDVHSSSKYKLSVFQGLIDDAVVNAADGAQLVNAWGNAAPEARKAFGNTTVAEAFDQYFCSKDVTQKEMLPGGTFARTGGVFQSLADELIAYNPDSDLNLAGGIDPDYVKNLFAGTSEDKVEEAKGHGKSFGLYRRGGGRFLSRFRIIRRIQQRRQAARFYRRYEQPDIVRPAANVKTGVKPAVALAQGEEKSVVVASNTKPASSTNNDTFVGPFTDSQILNQATDFSPMTSTTVDVNDLNLLSDIKNEVPVTAAPKSAIYVPTIAEAKSMGIPGPSIEPAPVPVNYAEKMKEIKDARVGEASYAAGYAFMDTLYNQATAPARYVKEKAGEAKDAANKYVIGPAKSGARYYYDSAKQTLVNMEQGAQNKINEAKATYTAGKTVIPLAAKYVKQSGENYVNNKINDAKIYTASKALQGAVMINKAKDKVSGAAKATKDAVSGAASGAWDWFTKDKTNS